MGNLIQFIPKTREKQKILLNGTEIAGVQSFDISFDHGAVYSPYIGMSNNAYLTRGPKTANINVSNQIISEDYFIQYTGNQAFNMYILRERPFSKRHEVRKYQELEIEGFISGYMTNYSQSCTLGEIPQTNINILAYGDAGKLNNTKNVQFSEDWINNVLRDDLIQEFKPANGYSADLFINELENIRLQSYNLSIEVTRTPVFGPGKRFPLFFHNNKSTVVDLEFQIEVDNWGMSYLQAYPRELKIDNLILTLNNIENGSVIKEYSFDNLILISQSKNLSVSNQEVATIRYQGIYH